MSEETKYEKIATEIGKNVSEAFTAPIVMPVRMLEETSTLLTEKIPMEISRTLKDIAYAPIEIPKVVFGVLLRAPIETVRTLPETARHLDELRENKPGEYRREVRGIADFIEDVLDLFIPG